MGRKERTGLRMLLVIVVTAVLLLQGCSAAVNGNAEEEAAGRLKGKVTKVVDGDTVDVRIAGKVERVRMVLVDTPETKHPNKPVEPFGPEASAFTKETLEGQEVELERDVTERDKYGRLLCYVYINGKLFQEMLLEQGLARVAVFPPDVKYVERFRDIQSRAQQQGTGIWSIENYATDKGYNLNAAEAAEDKSLMSGQDESKTEVFYRNCAEVEAAGAAPLRVGDPGYREAMDGDGDGVACE